MAFFSTLLLFSTPLAWCLPPVQVPLDVNVAGKAQIGPGLQLELHPPVFTPRESQKEECVHTQTLVEHVFENSYGRPFVGEYTPPSCPFNRVNIELTAKVKGRQFDRLGILYLGDIEIFRTSTSEPTLKGIQWLYTKEIDHYLALWRKEQTVIFDLPNIVNDVYTGPIHVTLNATFFTQAETRKHADAILPISAQRSPSHEGSAYLVPNERAVSKHSFNGNLSRAVVSLSACGQQQEEFWYTNVLESQKKTFKDTSGTLGGFSPYREVQLLIDGNLAGFSLPFPVIFTGGIAPGFWRPVVGIDAYDLRQHEIDITAWIEYLKDGDEHSFEIRVVGLKQDSNGNLTLSDRVGGYWVVTGTIFLFYGHQEEDGKSTQSTLPFITSPPANITVSTSTSLDADGRNESLAYIITVERQLNIFAFSSGISSWGQSARFFIHGNLSAYGLNQSISHLSSGLDLSRTDDGSSTFIYTYPLNLTSNLTLHPLDHGFSIHADLSRSLQTSLAGESVFPSGLQNWTLIDDWDPDRPYFLATTGPSLLTHPLHIHNTDDDKPPKIPVAGLGVHQNGSASYRAGKTNSGISGALDSELGFAAFTIMGEGGSEVFERHIEGVNGSWALDMWSLRGSNGEEEEEVGNYISDNGEVESEGTKEEDGDMWVPARESVREMLGRGDGRSSGKTGYVPFALAEGGMREVGAEL